MKSKALRQGHDPAKQQNAAWRFEMTLELCLSDCIIQPPELCFSSYCYYLDKTLNLMENVETHFDIVFLSGHWAVYLHQCVK